ncbi:hypothetical protein [Salipaludibacillus aurantiacus]|uniref:Uncharacterized protein n=1 Tax=Salipaludibacillus aurantiacus TaxID=1601833 RepID=A0A1H9UMD7_9BACI|nr:hypothetical protein [Salipaludibacillus aurantiacus]SES10616.1 hypothetical protein SAMN05518684_10846 [Salipaludibacillus aurantiacus]
MSNSNVTHGYNEGYGNINNFKSLLEEKGFVVQEGLLRYEDILKLCSLGIIEDCFGNHAGAPYALYLLPPAPNQNPSKGQRPPKGYDPQNPDNYPANIAYLSPGANFKLRPDEAIVLVGKTPPPAYYFSFRSYISFVQNKPEKDYSDYLTVGNEEIGEYHRLLNSLGDHLLAPPTWMSFGTAPSFLLRKKSQAEVPVKEKLTGKISQTISLSK